MGKKKGRVDNTPNNTNDTMSKNSEQDRAGLWK